ncbi:MAG: hypothetical protein H6R35_145 [Bacteroidetes bacterium]|nr:hypothetical protein [Bacteroidota bacterium]
MKRRFRQKQDLEPKNDPEKDKGLSDDGARENQNHQDNAGPPSLPARRPWNNR